MVTRFVSTKTMGEAAVALLLTNNNGGGGGGGGVVRLFLIFIINLWFYI